VERDVTKAATLYKKACDGGNTDACGRVKPAP
jgi:TPR repeat protein